MTASEITVRLRKLISDDLGVDASEVTLSARIVEDLGADSLDVLDLAMGAEEAFAIEIPEEDAEAIGTVGEFVRYVEAALARKAAVSA